MSIKSEITRIQNNVTASLRALQEKGVSVPAGANSDNLPGLIAQISGGTGDMETQVYDPQGKKTDIFAYVDERITSDAYKNAIADAVKASLDTETWTFTLDDGSTVTKEVYVSES